MTTATMLLVLCASPAADQAESRAAILDFTASWCSPCQQMKPAIAELVRSKYPVKAVDYDTSPLVRKYKITAVPTFVVVDAEGRELDRLSGYRPASDIASMYNNATAKQRPAPEEDDADDEEPAGAAKKPLPKPWETVVRIRIDNHLARPQSIEFGSGTIIHSTSEETIILTCAHIFKIKEARQPINAKKFPLKITVELSDGQLRAKSQRDSHGGVRAGVRMAEDYRGEAIDYEFGGDVGLIRIRPGKILPSTPVVGTDWKPRTGLEMTTVGCSEGKDATAWSTKISNPSFRGVDGLPNYEAIECLFAPKQGRSGGGLYTTDGKLAGVCDFAEPTGDHGLYATPRTIHKLLDRNKLAVCYSPDAGRPRTKGGTMLAQGRSTDKTKRTNVADTLRAQGPDDPKRLTIPSPDDLKVPRIVENDEFDPKSSPSSSDKRRKPVWSNRQVASGGRKLARYELDPPEPAEREVTPTVGSDSLERPIEPLREKTLPNGPESKPRSATPWKAAK